MAHPCRVDPLPQPTATYGTQCYLGQQHVFLSTPFAPAGIFCSVMHVTSSLLLRPCVLLESSWSSTTVLRAQYSRRERNDSSCPGDLADWSPVVIPGNEMPLLLFRLPIETHLFGVSLEALLEADRKTLPSTQVPLVLQAVSCLQVGLI